MLRHSRRYSPHVSDVVVWLFVSVEHSTRKKLIVFHLFLVSLVPRAFLGGNEWPGYENIS